jgi:hypothetical protein
MTLCYLYNLPNEVKFLALLQHISAWLTILAAPAPLCASNHARASSFNLDLAPYIYRNTTNLTQSLRRRRRARLALITA